MRMSWKFAGAILAVNFATVLVILKALEGEGIGILACRVVTTLIASITSIVAAGLMRKREAGEEQFVETWMIIALGWFATLVIVPAPNPLFPVPPILGIIPFPVVRPVAYSVIFASSVGASLAGIWIAGWMYGSLRGKKVLSGVLVMLFVVPPITAYVLIWDLYPTGFGTVAGLFVVAGFCLMTYQSIMGATRKIRILLGSLTIALVFFAPWTDLLNPVRSYGMDSHHPFSPGSIVFFALPSAFCAAVLTILGVKAWDKLLFLHYLIRQRQA